MKKVVVNYIKEIAFFLINGIRTVIYLICSLFPIQQNRIFINCFDGKGFGDNPKYIILELNKLNKRLEYCWVLGRNTNTEKNNLNIRYCTPFSFKAIYLQATSKIWISTVRMPYYSVKRKDQIYYHTWHAGIALKKVEKECEDALSPRYKRTARKDSKMIDYYISDNDDNSRLFKNYFWYNGGEILKFGSPRNDILINGLTSDIEVLKKKFNVIGKKVCIYAPTFRKDSSLRCYNINYENLRRTLGSRFGGDWVIIVRLHPRLESKSLKYIQYNNWLINGSKISDIQEVLLISDVLITDYSSISLDYINTKRPVFIYATDMDEYRSDRDFHLSLDDTPFSIATNDEELIENINKFDEIKYHKDIKSFMLRFGYYGNGDSSVKVAIHISQKLSLSTGDHNE